MANRVVELVREIMALQSKPLDKDAETDEEYLARQALEDEWIGGLYYKHNSIRWSHSRAVNYEREIQLAWDELRKLGIEQDGSTTVAQAIASMRQDS